MIPTEPSLDRQLRAVFLTFVMLLGSMTLVTGFGAAAPAAPGSTDTQTSMIQTQAQADQDQPNATAAIELNGTPDGLRLYNLTVTLSGSTDTNISSIQPGIIDGNEFEVIERPVDQQSVTFRAVDLSENVGRSTETRTLATLNLTNRSVAATDLQVSVNRLIDDSGNDIDSTRIDKTIETRSPVDTNTNPFPDGVPGIGTDSPNNIDDDSQFEDVNGDGEANFTDAVNLAFANRTSINNGTQSQIDALDFDGDGDIDFDDAIELAFDPALSS